MGQARHWIVAVLALSGLAGLLMLGVLTDVTQENFIAAIVVAILGFAAHVFLLRPVRSALDPEVLVSLVTVPFFVVFPVLQLYLGDFSEYHLVSPAPSFVAAALMVFVFIVSFSFGCRAALGRHRERIDGGAARLDTTPYRAMPIVLLVMMLFGTTMWFLYFRSAGGILHVLDNVRNKTQLTAGLGYYFLAANALQIASIIAVAHTLAGKTALPRLVVYASVAVSIVPYLVMGTRSRMVMFVLVIIILAQAVRRKAQLRQWVLVGLGTVAAIFVLGELRTLGGGRGETLDREKVSSAVAMDVQRFRERSVTDYGHFDRISLVYEYVPEQLPLQAGSTLASVALVFVPRTLYPGKPAGSGPLLANAFRRNAWDLEEGWTSGVTATIVGELYLNFWWPGVLIGGLLAGFASGRLYARWRATGWTIWNALKYALFAIYMLMAGTLGEFYGSVTAFAVLLILLYATRWLSKLAVSFNSTDAAGRWASTRRGSV